MVIVCINSPEEHREDLKESVSRRIPAQGTCHDVIAPRVARTVPAEST